MSTITTKDGADLLQGLGQRPGRDLLARLATELGRLGRPDAVPGATRLSLRSDRPTRSWPLSQPSVHNDMDGYADDLAAVIEALDLRDAVLIGHSTGGGEVAERSASGTGRVKKAVLVAAVPPIMLQTPANPEGLPMEVFDAIGPVCRAIAAILQGAGDRLLRREPSRAQVSQGILDQFWLWSMQAGSRGLTKASRPSRRPTSPRTSRSSTSRRWCSTARTTRSYRSRTRRRNRPGSSKAPRKSTIQARHTA